MARRRPAEGGTARPCTCRNSRSWERGAAAGLGTAALVSVTERTMVLELSQGKEGTTAGHAEYTRLEEEYARGMGL
eukprot:3502050-Prymnesium_polylepis.1